MKKEKIDIGAFLEAVRGQKPLVHHLTNWVTIYDCANVLKVFGASPVMAHAKEEVAEMSAISSALVLNIGTLTVELVKAMKIAAKSANSKDIPVVLDVCGAGATQLRDKSCFELLDDCRISVIKGNASEIARIAGERVRTKGVDSSNVAVNLQKLAKQLAAQRNCVVVITGQADIISDGKRIMLVDNGDPLMAHVVGTGCMAASVIGAFCAVGKDLVLASASGLACFEIAAELAARTAKGPGTFKEHLFDRIYKLDSKTANKMQKVYRVE